MYERLVPDEKREYVEGLLQGTDWMIFTDQPVDFQIEPPVLQSSVADILDTVLSDAEELLSQGEPEAALGRLNEGLRVLFTSLSSRRLSLEDLYDRTDKIRGVVAKTAYKLGSHEFTIEFCVGFPPSMTIGLHFKSEDMAVVEAEATSG